jgi:hypothetical protein
MSLVPVHYLSQYSSQRVTVAFEYGGAWRTILEFATASDQNRAAGCSVTVVILETKLDQSE